MKTKLITGLRTAANALEDGTFYYLWEKPCFCNCGALFCALTGKSAAEFEKQIPMLLSGQSRTWTNLIGQYCPITGMPTHELFRELFSYGLTQKDMVNLEYLDDPKVLARMGKLKVEEPTTPKRKWYQLPVEKPKTVSKYARKINVIAYMRAWADLLTEEGALDVVKEETAIPTYAANPPHELL